MHKKENNKVSWITERDNPVYMNSSGKKQRRILE